ncbi:endolytic transglycosylase MltG [Miniphocaeibacter massiliensis]|uniref:endolytic transglycosylase MltG n=1 Tax=Miniphocaeibacter massiliensis TaxID=2041841 RepID=UPI000C08AF36|nr:endolytic transglycosylase MltG [Miniphocaeibacter massiliensis]
MKRFINFIKDTVYDLNILIFTLIVIVLVGFVLQNRIHAMYSADYGVKRENMKTSLSQVEVEDVYSDENAPKIDINVTLPEGSSIIDISRILTEYKVISDPEEFLNYVKTNNLESSIKHGQFTISKGSSLEEVVNIITGNTSSEENTTEPNASPDASKNNENSNFDNLVPSPIQ